MFSNLRSLIFKLDPETAHNLAIKSLKFNFVPNILDGNCKLQWKVDWAMRWYALDVDFEMYGKDLILNKIK